MEGDLIDYEKCRTQRIGLYVLLALILFAVVVVRAISSRIESKLDALQPCVQASVNK